MRWNYSQCCWKFHEIAATRFWNAESFISVELIWTKLDSKLMSCLPLLFSAVKLAQVIRWSKPVYCNHLVLMTVFVHGRWLNMSFISLRLSQTPTGQHSLLIKHLLSRSLWILISFSFAFFFTFLLSFHSAFALSHCSHTPSQSVSLFPPNGSQRETKWDCHQIWFM